MAQRISTNPVWQLLDENGETIASINNDGSTTTVIGAPGIGTFPIQIKVLLTSAQLLTLKGTPQVLIPAPGAGKIIYVDQVSFRYLFNSVAYTLNAGTIKVFEGPSANAKSIIASVATGLIDQVVNTSNLGIPALATGNLTDAQGINVPITIANDGAAEFTLGNGTLEVIVNYTIVAVP